MWKNESVCEKEFYLILVFVCTEEFEEFSVGLSLSRGWAALASPVRRCAVVDESRVCSVRDLVDVENKESNHASSQHI